LPGFLRLPLQWCLADVKTLVFKGTRLTVERVLRELGTGMSQKGIVDNYPKLEPEHIQAAHQYAADIVAMDECIFQ